MEQYCFHVIISIQPSTVQIMTGGRGRVVDRSILPILNKIQKHTPTDFIVYCIQMEITDKTLCDFTIS